MNSKYLIWLGPLLVGIILWLTPQLIAPPTLEYRFGAEAGLNEYGEGHQLYNFFGWSEPQPIDTTTIRRSTADGSMVIPWAFRLGQPLEVTVRWCECEPIAQPLSLTINTQTYPLPDSWGFREDTYLVSYEPSIYERDLFLMWSAPEAFGPAVEYVRVEAATWDGRWDGTFWAVAGLLLIVALGWRTMSLSELGAWIAANGAALIIGRVLYEIQLLPWTALVVLGLAYALLLTWFVRDGVARYVLWGCGLWLLASSQVLGSWVLDDAFISFRYSRNLLEGYGLTFNPGGEIVEGYTNFLWTMQMAWMLALGYEPLVAAHWWTLAFALATVLLVYRFAATQWERWWALLPPLLLTINPHFVLYTARGSGMETAQVTLLSLAALWLLWRIRDQRTAFSAGLLCAVVAMARPDGALVPLAGGTLLVLRLLIQPQKRALLAQIGALCAGFALLYGPYFIWRYSYYGYLLPNTFYAKTGFTAAQAVRGWRYSLDFVTLSGFRSVIGLLLLSWIGLIIAGRKSPRQAVTIWLLWLFILWTLVYVVVVGGDHFPNGRFFISALPPLMLLLTYAVYAFWQARNSAPTLLQWLGRAGSVALLLLFMLRNIQQYPATDSRIPGRPIWGRKQRSPEKS